MRRSKEVPTITFVFSEHRADLTWITAILIRRTLESSAVPTHEPPEDCPQPAGAVTPGMTGDRPLRRQHRTHRHRSTT